MSRFDYIKYDSAAVFEQEKFKAKVTELEVMIDSIGKTDPKASGRARALAITKLEEVYMWIGKAIRDDQISRNDGAVFLQEQRNNG